MDVISIVVSGILIVVLIIIIALLIRLYRNTRYTPIIFITTFFIILFINMLIYMPVLWLPYSESELIFLLFEITAYPLIMFFPLFVLFFEGMKGRFNSSISTVFLIYSCFIMGYMAIESPWEFEWSNRWHQIFNDDFIILTGILLVSFYVYVYYRLIQFVREKGSGRPKQMTIIAISGLTIALAGTFISMTLNLFYLDFIAWIIGFSIVAMAYLKEPESFFLSNTNIEAIFLLNSESQILYVNLGYLRELTLPLQRQGLGVQQPWFKKYWMMNIRQLNSSTRIKGFYSSTILIITWLA